MEDKLSKAITSMRKERGAKTSRRRAKGAEQGAGKHAADIRGLARSPNAREHAAKAFLLGSSFFFLERRATSTTARPRLVSSQEARFQNGGFPLLSQLPPFLRTVPGAYFRTSQLCNSWRGCQDPSFWKLLMWASATSVRSRSARQGVAGDVP